MKWKKESSEKKPSILPEDECSTMTHSLVEQIQQTRDPVNDDIWHHKLHQELNWWNQLVIIYVGAAKKNMSGASGKPTLCT